MYNPDKSRCIEKNGYKKYNSLTMPQIMISHIKPEQHDIPNYKTKGKDITRETKTYNPIITPQIHVRYTISKRYLIRVISYIFKQQSTH